MQLRKVCQSPYVSCVANVSTLTDTERSCTTARWNRLASRLNRRMRALWMPQLSWGSWIDCCQSYLLVDIDVSSSLNSRWVDCIISEFWI